ncbi:MAG: hypothetical protein AABY15_02825 [Nanoarchaeota archaeon]
MKKAFRISIVVYGAMMILALFCLLVGFIAFGPKPPLPFWFSMIMATLMLFPIPIVAILGIIAHAKDVIKDAKNFIETGK